MTMILTAVSDEIGLFALGDILTSTTQHVGSGLPLPLQFDALVRKSGDHSLSGFAQKLTLVTPTVLVSWAGSYAVARLLIQVIKDAAEPDTLIDLAEVVEASGLGESEVREVSLIVHQLLGGRIDIQFLNSEHGPIEGVQAAWSGTGSFDFLTDTLIGRGGEGAHFAEILRGLLLRVAVTLAGEAIHGSNYDYLYGGWFELVISRTLGLRKIPYAIKFWSRRPGQYGYDAPLFFNWYKGSSLFVCSLDQHSGRSDVRVIEVPDLLTGKAWRRVKVKPKYAPEFTFHVVLDENEPHNAIVISDRHSIGHMDVSVTKSGNYTMKVQSGLIDHIMANAVTPGFVVRKASDIAD